MNTTKSSDSAQDKNQMVHFEETLSTNDKEIYKWLPIVTWGILILTNFGFIFFILFSLLFFLLILTLRSGTDDPEKALSLALSIIPNSSVIFFVILFIIMIIICGIFFAGLFAFMQRLSLQEKIHTQVTDTGIKIDSEGLLSIFNNIHRNFFKQSKIDIRFETISKIEYTDPDNSSLRINLGDWRAYKYIAGRSKNWIRIERVDGPAIYLGSDNPIKLAKTIAEKAPNVETAKPF